MTAADALPPLPSLFRPVMLREGGDAMARAVELAPEEGPQTPSSRGAPSSVSPSRGAGTLVWVRAYARCEAAVVLEPEQPLAQARLAFHAGANALADALAALAPPERPIRLRWPGTLMVHGAACGRVRLSVPPGAAPGAPPAWLVLGFEARLAHPEGFVPGSAPGETSLAEEGFEELAPARLVHGWALHLMAGLDEWQARGPRRVAERFLARLDDFDGARRGVDPADGALVVEHEGGARERWELPG